MPGASSRHVSQNGDQNQNIKGFSPLTTDRRLTNSPVAASNISMSGTSSEIATVGAAAVVVVAGTSVVVVDASVVVVVAGASVVVVVGDGSVVVVVGASVVVVVVVSTAAVVVVAGSVVVAVASEVTAAAVDEVVAEVVDVGSGSAAASEVVVPGGWEVLPTVASVRATVVVGLSVGGLVAVPVASPPQAMTAPATSAIAMTDGISRKSVPVRGGAVSVPGYRAEEGAEKGGGWLARDDSTWGFVADNRANWTFFSTLLAMATG
jgi:hypothetical protein